MAWAQVRPQLSQAIRAGIDGWYGVATHRNLITGKTTPLDIVDGSVLDDATADIRRTLSLTLPGSAATWDALNTQGGEITVSQVVTYVDQSTDKIPLGVFIVDQEQLDYAPDGTITMTCPDRMLKVQRNKFGLARSSVPGNAQWQEIVRLLQGAWPGTTYGFPGWGTDTAGNVRLDKTATGKAGILTWDDGDRSAAIQQFVQGNGLELFFDRLGQAVLQKVPQLTPTSIPSWTVDASASGVMIGAVRTRDRSNLRNAIIATTSASDVVFNPVLVQNTTAGDPLNVTGPLGFVPENWSLPTFRNSAQARNAATVRLSKRLGNSQSVQLTAEPNPTLDAGDVIMAQYPQIDVNSAPTTELHIIDSVSHPLTPTGTQDIQTRSTRPLSDGS